VSRSK